MNVRVRAFFAFAGVRGVGGRLRTTWVSAVILAGGMLTLGAFAATPALALETHAFSTSFAGEGEHALSDPQGVAIDQSTGEVYVVDGANNRVEVFSASGAFIKAFGTEGSGNGQFYEPTQIAVDNSTGMPGDVYVLDHGTEQSNERVEVFNAKGEYQSQIMTDNLPEAPTEPGFCEGASSSPGPIEGIAVDSSGNLWVFDNQPGGRGCTEARDVMYELGPGGAEPYHYVFAQVAPPVGHPGLAIDSSGNLYYLKGAVAIDPADQDLYQAGGDQVAHFLAPNTGPVHDVFGATGPNALVAAAGVAVNGSSDDVYVADSARGRVDVFDSGITLAEVTVEPPTGVEQATATLHGTVNPEGIAVTSCVFEWGTQPGVFPHTASCSPSPGEGKSPVAVEAQISGLTPASRYSYRLAVTDASGTNYGQGDIGPTESFTTFPAVQGLDTGPAEAVTPSSAKLTGSLSPDGTDAHYYFEYGTETTPEGPCSEAAGCFESPREPGTDAGSGGAKCKPPGGAECSPVAAETTLSGLAANATYHYRLVGVDSFGTTYGADATFKTSGPPTIESTSAEVAPESKAGQSSATLQAQVDPHGHETTYQFEYGETTSYGTSVPIPPGEIGSGETPVSVPAAELSGLKIDTTYHYRVHASSECNPVKEPGHRCVVDGPDETFTTLAAALVEDSASDVAATSATLEARVNPLGSATTCEFQYVTEASFQSTGYDTASAAPCPAGLGEGETGVLASVHVQGLVPNNVYHYRVIVSNALAPAAGLDGPDHTFTTQAPGAFALPDDRQWEMVSPEVKEGARITTPGQDSAVTQAAAEGDAITYQTNVPTETGVAGYANVAQVLSTRGAHGWASRDLAIVHNGAVGQDLDGFEFRFFSEDLSQAVIQPLGAFLPCESAQGVAQPCLSEAASEQTAFVHTDFAPSAPGASTIEPGQVCGTDCFRPIETGCPGEGKPCPPAIEEIADVPEGTHFGEEGGPCPPERFCGPFFIGASPDGSNVILGAFYDESPLTEWSSEKPAMRQLAPVSVLPASEEEAKKDEGGKEVLGDLGGLQALKTGQDDTQARNAISDDGSRVFWTENGGSYNLYLRDVPREETIEIGGEGANYEDANTQGSRMFFTERGSLYECEIPEKLECKPTRLGEAPGQERNENGQVIGTSEDGSYVYWVENNGRLVMDHYEGSAKAWQKTAIAALSDEDSNDWASSQENLTARVSPDGRWLAFMSDEQLTGYDNHDANSGHADEEVYEYHAPPNPGTEAGTLNCASCDPTGARPEGVEYGKEGINMPLVGLQYVWNEHAWLAADLPGWQPQYAAGSEVYQPRYLSDSGRLFFDSDSELVPKDIDGTWDVYEYEPEGVGKCESAGSTSGSVVYEPAHRYETQGREGEADAGCVGLISSGESTQESTFIDASESGGDVFFLTKDALVPQDIEGSASVYDAHECTTQSPCTPNPVPPGPECSTAESCRAAPMPQPSIYGAPASATFSGTGNLTPAAPAAKPAAKKKTVQCKKHYVKNKKGRCVKKPKQKKNKAKKSAHINRRTGR